MNPSTEHPLKRIFAVKEVGILLILIGMILAISLGTDSFATRSNTLSILQAIAPIAIMGIGQTIVILTAGIDLSVGSVCALSAYAMSLLLIGDSHFPLWVALLAALGTGAGCGLLTGLVVAKLKVTPFIVTLGMLSACSGLTLGLSGGKQIGLNKFGPAETITASFLNPYAALEGQPDVERRFYAESGEATALLPFSSDRLWLAAANPGVVTLIDGKWEAVAKIAMEEDRIDALAAGPDESVYAAGAPGGKVWICRPDGTKELFFESGSESVRALLTLPDGSLLVGTGNPGKILLLNSSGMTQTEWTLESDQSATSFGIGDGGRILVALSNPAQLSLLDPGGEMEVLHSAESGMLGVIRVSEEGDIWYAAGESELGELWRWKEGKSTLVWDSPRKPIRDFLVYPERVVVASTGNVGAASLIRGDAPPESLHSMTAHKARILAKAPDGDSILIGNAGPAGVGTMTTQTTLTAYTQAEVFNNLHVHAPLCALVLMFLAWLFLRFTRWGTYVYAIGGNETAARLSGIKVDRIKILAYTITGLLSGVAAVFLTSKLHTLDPNLAKGYELKVIAAVVIGGTSLMGGEGSVWGTLIGATLLFVMNYALVHLGMEDIWSDLFIGIVIILAAVLDSTRSRLPRIWLTLKQRLGGG